METPFVAAINPGDYGSREAHDSADYRAADAGSRRMRR